MPVRLAESTGPGLLLQRPRLGRQTYMTALESRKLPTRSGHAHLGHFGDSRSRLRKDSVQFPGN